MASCVQNNHLDHSFKCCYKPFTRVLQHFTIKRHRDSSPRIYLRYCFTKKTLVMNTIYNLAFWLLFVFSFLIDKVSVSPASCHVPDSLPEQKGAKEAAAKIVFKSSDGGQTSQDITNGLCEPVQDDN